MGKEKRGCHEDEKGSDLDCCVAAPVGCVVGLYQSVQKGRDCVRNFEKTSRRGSEREKMLSMRRRGCWRPDWFVLRREKSV